MKKLLLVLSLSLALVGLNPTPTHAAITLVAHGAEGLGVNGGTTAGAGVINSTGADLITAFLAVDGTIAQFDLITLSDSKSNTWIPIPRCWNSGDVGGQLFYAKNATVGTGHTFTSAVTSSYVTIIVAAWAGSDTTTPLDQDSNSCTGNAGTTFTAGSVTPSSDDELVISATGSFAASTTIDGGFTELDDIAASALIIMVGV